MARSAALVISFVTALGAFGAMAGVVEAQPMSDTDFAAAMAALGAPDAEARAAAADSLGRNGYDRRDAISIRVRELLRTDPDWRVRASCGRAIGRLATRDAVPDLVRALRDPVVDVRVVSAAALWRLPDPAAVVPLVELLGDADPSARQWAALALGVIRDRRATAPLSALLGDTVAAVRLDAIRSLGRVRDPTATQALSELVANSTRVIDERLEAINSLAALEGPEKTDALVRLLGQADAQVRIRVAEALGQVGDALVIPALRRQREGETNPRVRRAIDAALGAVAERARGGGTTTEPLHLPPLPGEG